MKCVPIQEISGVWFLSASKHDTAALYVLLLTGNEAVCRDGEVLIDTMLIASFEVTQLISAYNADDC
jgi:hypothetical protein